jgi:hypothetical protein
MARELVPPDDPEDDMSQTTTAEPAGRNTEEGDAAWIALRSAIAQEYVGKLPDMLTIAEFACFAGMTTRQVRHSAIAGELVVCTRDGVRGIAPAENVGFLLRERLLQLTADPARTSPAIDTRSLTVSEATYERVWDEAVRTDSTPAEALDRLLRGTTATTRRNPSRGRRSRAALTNA